MNKRRVNFLPLPFCRHAGYKQHRMSLNEPWWSVHAHQHKSYACKRERAGLKRKGGSQVGERGLASNLQGQASNTIWRETIQFAGTREGGGGQMRDRSRKINRSEVRGQRQEVWICFRVTERKREQGHTLSYSLSRQKIPVLVLIKIYPPG